MRTTGCVLLAALVAGCAGSQATIQTVHPPLGHRKVETQQAAYQYSRGRDGTDIEVAAAGVWTLAGGEAVPDFEYLYLRVPEQAGTYRPGREGVEVRRLVRVAKEEFLYRATAGWIRTSFGFLDRSHLEVEFDLETELMAPAPASATGQQGAASATAVPAAPTAAPKTYRLTGKISVRESMELTQGLINKYGDEVRRLEDLANPPRPKAK